MTTPQRKNPCQGGYEMYIFFRPWPSLLYTSFVGTMTQSSEEYCLKKYINFTILTPKLPPHYGGSS